MVLKGSLIIGWCNKRAFLSNYCAIFDVDYNEDLVYFLTVLENGSMLWIDITDNLMIKHLIKGK
jgi:hypothetical protein